jgi:enoyl-CoA hydratase/carnithine racemase
LATSPLTPVKVVDAASAFALVGGGRDTEAVGALAGAPLLAVDDLESAPAAFASVARRLPCVVIGIASTSISPAPQLDILLTPEVDPPRPWVHCANGVGPVLERLAETVREAPLASVTLVQLLRLMPSLGVVDGLIAESLAYATLQAGPEFQRWLATAHRPPVDDSLAPAVIVDRTGTTLNITLNRPARRNAYSAAMRDGLVAALAIATSDSSVLNVELGGAGPSFCSGGDLAEFGTTPNPAEAHIVRTTRSAAARLHECSDRVTAHLHGACVGAGIELPAFARRVVCHADTFVLLPEVRMGLVPGAGGTVSLTGRIGRERTAYLALMGTAVDADTAHRWGLVDAILPGAVESR